MIRNGHKIKYLPNGVDDIWIGHEEFCGNFLKLRQKSSIVHGAIKISWQKLHEVKQLAANAA